MTPKFDDPRIKGQPRKARNVLFFKRFWRDPSFWVIGVDPRFGGHWTLRRGGGGVCALRRALRLKRCSEVQSTRTPGPGRRRVLLPVSPSSVPKSGVKQNKQQAKHLRSVCAWPHFWGHKSGVSCDKSKPADAHLAPRPLHGGDAAGRRLASGRRRQRKRRTRGNLPWQQCAQTR